MRAPSRSHATRREAGASPRRAPGAHGRALADPRGVRDQGAVAQAVAAGALDPERDALLALGGRGAAERPGHGGDGVRARARSRSSAPPCTPAAPGPGSPNWSRKTAGAPAGSASGKTKPSSVAARPVAGSAPSAAVVPPTAGAAPPQAVTTGGPAGVGAGSRRRPEQRAPRRRSRARRPGRRAGSSAPGRRRGRRSRRRCRRSSWRSARSGRWPPRAAPTWRRWWRGSCGPRAGSRRASVPTARTIASRSEAKAMPGPSPNGLLISCAGP